jgi:hypothetical protein
MSTIKMRITATWAFCPFCALTALEADSMEHSASASCRRVAVFKFKDGNLHIRQEFGNSRVLSEEKKPVAFREGCRI